MKVINKAKDISGNAGEEIRNYFTDFRKVIEGGRVPGSSLWLLT
jgi:hypothetical protein